MCLSGPQRRSRNPYWLFIKDERITENSWHLHSRVFLKYLPICILLTLWNITFKITALQWEKNRQAPTVSRRFPSVTCQSCWNRMTTPLEPSRILNKRYIQTGKSSGYYYLLNCPAQKCPSELQTTRTSGFRYQLASLSELSNVFILKHVGRLLSQSSIFSVFTMVDITSCGLWVYSGWQVSSWIYRSPWMTDLVKIVLLSQWLQWDTYLRELSLTVRGHEVDPIPSHPPEHCI